jgi:ribonucleotide reductase beta subunit family protein with ferritin-like domain
MSVAEELKTKLIKGIKEEDDFIEVLKEEFKKLKEQASQSIDEDIINELKEIDSSDEPLIQDNLDVFNLGNLSKNDQEEYTLYKKHQIAYWPAEEVSMNDDIKDWENLLYDQTSVSLSKEQREINKKKNDDARFFIKMTLAFFASADGIVNANIARFLMEITNPYVKLYYGWQIAMEGIHSEAYKLMIENLITDKKEKFELFRAIYNSDVIRKKAMFALKYLEHPDPKHYINSKNSLALRLVASATIEIIQFSSSFASIYWIRSKGVMIGLSQYNKQIARDEGLHGEHHCCLYNREIKHRLPVKIVHKILLEAYNFEKEFFYKSLPVALVGINADEMDMYVKLVVIREAEMLGYPPMFEQIENPFTWMEKINLNSKDNLHEVASGEYQNPMLNDVVRWGFKMNF